MKKKSFSSHQITDCDDIYHLYRQLLCEQANQKQIVVCYYCYYYYDYLCITYPWTCTVPLYSRKVAGICIWRAHTAPEHSNGNEWEIYPSFMSLYLFPTERAHIYPKPTSEPANKRAKETWVCLLDSCVAFRFRSHPLLAQRIFCLPLVYVWRVCVCVCCRRAFCTLAFLVHTYGLLSFSQKRKTFEQVQYAGTEPKSQKKASAALVKAFRPVKILGPSMVDSFIFSCAYMQIKL